MDERALIIGNWTGWLEAASWCVHSLAVRLWYGADWLIKANSRFFPFRIPAHVTVLPFSLFLFFFLHLSVRRNVYRRHVGESHQIVSCFVDAEGTTETFGIFTSSSQNDSRVSLRCEATASRVSLSDRQT